MYDVMQHLLLQTQSLICQKFFIRANWRSAGVSQQRCRRTLGSLWRFFNENNAF